MRSVSKGEVVQAHPWINFKWNSIQSGILNESGLFLPAP